MKKRSFLSLAVVLLAAVALSVTLLGCGKNFYFAGRNLPPSGLTQRVLIAVQNPASSLQFVDAFYDIRHPFNNPNGQFNIGGYTGLNPASIQNLPEEQSGLVYASGDGSLTAINYATEKVASSPVRPGGAIATMILAARKQDYFVSADQNARSLTVLDTALGTFQLNVPGIFRVAVNTNATLVLGFVQDSNAVYSVIKLNPAQQAQYSTQAAWTSAGFQDCEPQTLPRYCVGQVGDPSQLFDRPTRALFSADGQSIYVLNCGPECGGQRAGIITIPLSSLVLNNNPSGPSGLPPINSASGVAQPGLTAASVLAVPGGATNALQAGNTLYVAGQQFKGQLLAGTLSIVDVPSNTVTASYSISDGIHNKMSLGDDNTLWIGSIRCQSGYRFAQRQAGVPDSNGQPIEFGCLTRFDRTPNAANPVTVDRYIGDLTGIANVEGLHKMYVGEGGQVHIYRTSDFGELDNSQVTVTGTVSDVAYMDGSSDGNNTTY